MNDETACRCDYENQTFLICEHCLRERDELGREVSKLRAECAELKQERRDWYENVEKQLIGAREEGVIAGIALAYEDLRRNGFTGTEEATKRLQDEWRKRAERK